MARELHKCQHLESGRKQQ